MPTFVLAPKLFGGWVLEYSDELNTRIIGQASDVGFWRPYLELNVGRTRWPLLFGSLSGFFHRSTISPFASGFGFGCVATFAFFSVHMLAPSFSRPSETPDFPAR